MLPVGTKLISVDDHIIEHPTVWSDRLPVRLRDEGPHVIEQSDGREAWVYEGAVIPLRQGNAKTKPGIPCDPSGDGHGRFDEMVPGCWNPKERIVDMDADGVWAQLGFPDFARFSGHRFLNSKNPELGKLCVSAYNDYVIDEWCATQPDRLFPLVIVPYWDLDAAINELHRVAAKGARAVAFSENPATMGLASVHNRQWDPLWAAIGEVDIPICMHIGSSSRVVLSAPDAPYAAGLTIIGTNSMMACSDWLFSGILERFPTLQVVFSEGGAGWAPYIIERAMESFVQYHPTSGATVPPDELFYGHMHVCMLREAFPLTIVDRFPVDNLLWESDFPHQSGSYPNSRRHFAEAVKDVPDEVAVKVAETNARRLFKI